MKLPTLKQLKRSVIKYKDGLISGGVVGLLAAHYVYTQGIDLTVLAESGKGLLDGMMGRSTVVEIARVKLYSMFVLIGASTGMILDILLTRFGLRK